MSRPVYQNASLIREMRMLAQQFFRHKENETFWGGRQAKTVVVPAPEPWVPKCVRCITRKKEGFTTAEPRAAVTLVGGSALCVQHV